MTDRFNRKIEYLRLSITSRCDLRCLYCRNGRKTPTTEPTLEEIERIGRAAARLGIKKIRLTGGEPLMRSDVAEIVSSLAGLGAFEEITLTTNGEKLSERARDLYEAGVKRVNISLDSLRPETYSKITGGVFEKAEAGLQAALDAGMSPVKINVVPLRGINDGEIEDFIRMSEEKNVEARFIELMPFGGLADKSRLRITADEILKRAPYLKETSRGGGPARTFETPRGGRIGIISPFSRPFCATCNRIRILSNLSARPCLGRPEEYPLGAFIGGADEALENEMRKIILKKPEKYLMSDYDAFPEDMSGIGG